MLLMMEVPHPGRHRRMEMAHLKSLKANIFTTNHILTDFQTVMFASQSKMQTINCLGPLYATRTKGISSGEQYYITPVLADMSVHLVMSRFDVCQELSPEATVSKTTYKSASAGDKSTMKTPGRDDHGGDSCESFDTNEYSGCIYYSRRVQN
mmetsp:Transcript_6213/g.13115  ORF Transcript_6213/g.13115 Transcript_6213/m.13115 type:complete len:152 (-) Transcript_6213:116-571(-)